MKIPDLTKKEMLDLIESHDNIRQILITLGKSSNGSGSYQSFKNHCNRLGIELPKINKVTNRTYGKIDKIPLELILIVNSSYQNTTHLKNRLIGEGLIKYECVICGNEGKWNKKPISLHLDHINGIKNDNRFENLRILCPNCHSQTETYGGKRFKKISRCVCGNIKFKNVKLCNKCVRFKKRKVNRPPYEQLMSEIKETNYCAVGRKYGVSDNAIRKWCKVYENEIIRRGARDGLLD